eukprot:5209404-Lingulodinium_polyedra.AAC.1
MSRFWTGEEPPGKGVYPASDCKIRYDGIWVRFDASNRGCPVDKYGERWYRPKGRIWDYNLRPTE